MAEVSFGEWTRDGHIRHSVFQGLRSDKKAETIIREKAVHTTDAKPVNAVSKPSLKVSHPERVIDTSTGFTKIQLIRYYLLVAPLMLEHLKNRPVSLVRAPDGITGQLFSRSIGKKRIWKGVNQLDQALDPAHDQLIEVTTADGLLASAQMM